MITQQQFKDHYNNLYNSSAIYVWGANGEIITKELIDRLYKTYGSSTYNRAYYDNKLKEGNGKIGADCSGSIYPLSKSDNTAKGYYNACTKKGYINAMSKDNVCLVFNKNFTHVGAYLGDGTTVEMMNSKSNCVKQAFNKSRWAYYGIPNWLETEPSYAEIITSINPKKEIVKNIQEWCNEYCKTNLVIDGIYGPKTKKGLCQALQHCLNINFNANLKEDGIFGQNTKSKCKIASTNKELTYICQAMLFFNGYSLNIKNKDLDGLYDQTTKNAVLEYQQNTRGLRHDGICGPATFYAMFNNK